MVKKKLLKKFILILCTLHLVGIAAAQVNSSVEIANSLPTLSQNIPDISIPTNTNLTNALDLDDYFNDLNGDTLTFTYPTIQNITILIDSNNSVSFYPDPDYIGNQTMNITAADDYGNVTSNNFEVVVGEDTEAPLWSSPLRSRTKIYQNFFVDFSVSWTDNTALSSYSFSINQGGGWTNATPVEFTGVSNTSTVKYQISASAGTDVQWRFYANDSSGNQNESSIEEFTVLTLPSSSSSSSSSSSGTSSSSTSGTSSLTGGTGGQSAPSLLSPSEKFTADTQNLKVTLRQGDVLTRVVRIKNTADNVISFSVNLSGLEEFAFLADRTFTLGPGESFDILIEFQIPKDTKPGQYFGFLSILGEGSLEIPIVLDVKPFNPEISLDVNISEKNKVVRPGENVTATITVENLGDIRGSKGELSYTLKDFNGNILDAASEEIELFATFQSEKKLQVPSTIAGGEYLFYARFISDDLIDLDSDTFFIQERFSLKKLIEKFLYPLALLLLILILLSLILAYKRAKRKRKLLELYLLLNELRGLVKEGKTTEAIGIYQRIKVVYGVHMPKGSREDQEKLKKELDKFSKILKENPIKEEPPKEAEGKEGAKEEEEKESGKEGEEKGEEAGENEEGKEKTSEVASPKDPEKSEGSAEEAKEKTSKEENVPKGIKEEEKEISAGEGNEKGKSLEAGPSKELEKKEESLEEEAEKGKEENSKSAGEKEGGNNGLPPETEPKGPSPAIEPSEEEKNEEKKKNE